MTRNRFLKKNKSWFEGAGIQSSVGMHCPCPFSSLEANQPQGWLDNHLIRQKKLRVKDLVQPRCASELTTAAEVVKRLLGDRSVATLIFESSDMEK